MNYRIKVTYRHFNKNGQNFNILETIDFGYKLSVLSDIEPKSENGMLFIDYDPNKAYIYVNQNGYLTLKIGK